MQNKRVHSKAKKPSLLEYPPNIEYGENGDIAFVTSPSIGTLLCIKSRNSWWANKFKNLKDLNKNIFEDLQVSGNVEFTTKSNVMFRSGLSTPSDIYLRNSKIYFDMSETTPNDYITGGLNDLEFYTSGTKRLDIGVTSSTFSNALIASSTLEVSDDIKLASTKKLYFDGGQDTYITSSPDNQLNFYTGGGVGATNILNLTHNAITSIASDITIENSVSTKPILTLKNTTNDAEAPYIKLLSQRGATAADAQDSDYLGYIEFNGYDDGTPSTQTYATISSNITDASSGDEVGSLFLKAAANNGTLASGISLIGDASALRADTTIHGKLTVNSISSGDGSGENFLVENSGEVQKRTAAEVRSDIGAGTSSVASLNDLSDVTYSSGDLTISSIDTIISGDLTIDSSGDIILDTTSGNGEGILLKDESTTYGMFDIHHSATYFTLYENGGASTDDYMKLYVKEHGETYILTNDTASNNANFRLHIDGDIKLNPYGGMNVTIYNDAGYINAMHDFKGASHYLAEQADALADNAGFGQLWVHDTAPNELCFTDDAGTDIIGIGKYQYQVKVVNWFNNGTSQIYLPIAGYILEQTGTGSRNEFVGMVAPYNGTVEKFMFRCEEAQDGTLEFDILESSDGTENPGTTIGVKDTVIDIADDTSVEVTFSSMTSGTNALVKGRIYAFRVDTPSAPNDSNGTLVFKWDITS